MYANIQSYTKAFFSNFWTNFLTGKTTYVPVLVIILFDYVDEHIFTLKIFKLKLRMYIFF